MLRPRREMFAAPAASSSVTEAFGSHAQVTPAEMGGEGAAVQFRSRVPRREACGENGAARQRRRVPHEGALIADRAQERRCLPDRSGWQSSAASVAEKPLSRRQRRHAKTAAKVAARPFDRRRIPWNLDASPCWYYFMTT
jgi:hypothetical protein